MVLAPASLHKRQGKNPDLSRANVVVDAPPAFYFFPQRLFPPVEAVRLEELLCQLLDSRRVGYRGRNGLIAILDDQDIEGWRKGHSHDSTSEQVQEADENERPLENRLCRDDHIPPGAAQVDRIACESMRELRQHERRNHPGQDFPAIDPRMALLLIW